MRNGSSRITQEITVELKDVPLVLAVTWTSDFCNWSRKFSPA